MACAPFGSTGAVVANMKGHMCLIVELAVQIALEDVDEAKVKRSMYYKGIEADNLK